MKVLYEKFLENCTDPIASVRQGGACSLGYLVKANKEFLDPTIKEGINSGSLVKWGASSECSSSLYYHRRNLDEISIGKTCPSLPNQYRASHKLGQQVYTVESLFVTVSKI